MAIGPLTRRSVAVDGPPPLPKNSHKIGENLVSIFLNDESEKNVIKIIQQFLMFHLASL
jgi:hypothetical protein